MVVFIIDLQEKRTFVLEGLTHGAVRYDGKTFYCRAGGYERINEGGREVRIYLPVSDFFWHVDPTPSTPLGEGIIYSRNGRFAALIS